VDYDTITLRLFVEIARTKEYEKLRISGRGGNPFEAWEQIVSKNEVDSGVNEFRNYLKIFKRHQELISEYQMVKTIIVFLQIKVSYKLIDFLNTKGYRINKEKSKYDDSLAQASRKADNLLTKIKIKENELRTVNGSGEKSKAFNIEHMIANLRVQLAPTIIPDDIKLVTYNYYNRVIKERSRKRER
jgi:hypothetical protein